MPTPSDPPRHQQAISYIATLQAELDGEIRVCEKRLAELQREREQLAHGVRMLFASE